MTLTVVCGRGPPGLLARFRGFAGAAAGSAHPTARVRRGRAAALCGGEPGDGPDDRFGGNQCEGAGGDGDAAGGHFDLIGERGAGPAARPQRVGGGYAGSVSPPGVATLINDPDRRRDLAEAAYAHAVRNFDWTRDRRKAARAISRSVDWRTGDTRPARPRATAGTRSRR